MVEYPSRRARPARERLNLHRRGAAAAANQLGAAGLPGAGLRSEIASFAVAVPGILADAKPADAILQVPDVVVIWPAGLQPR